MKSFAFSFFIYLLGLSFVPCRDFIQNCNNAPEFFHEHQFQDNPNDESDHDDHEHHPHKDNCNPLCSCSCCGTAALLTVFKNVHIKIQQIGIALKMIPYYNETLSIESVANIWQPPKFSA
ncbi:MAG TPA: hypothetical protein PKD32_11330 [Saprospiraceae bacterium]|nr:hypothetical protein [Saprospiraceae bacterium]